MKHNISAEVLLKKIREMDVGTVNLMEVCGTHTMAIAKAGIKRMLPENVQLISGPGCPVCVTPEEVIDGVLSLTARKDLIITAYGDMMRVPGSTRGDNLARRRAMGAEVRIVYSPLDAVEIARANPQREVVFLGAGFETTAPGTAAAVRVAAEGDIQNFSVFSMLKMVEPAVRALCAEPDFNVQGFLCPGHVAVVTGEEGLRFITDELKVPAVIAGFEPEDILLSIYMLLRQIQQGKPRLENQYARVVARSGNVLARKMVETYFAPRRDIWRGLGVIENSGLGLKPEYRAFDAEEKFDVHWKPSEKKSACRCGDVIRGKIGPRQCPLFGTVCLPEDPVGPCMVSSEGACAAAWKYQEI